MTKRRPRSPPDTSNLRPRAGVAGPCLPTLPSPLSLRPRLGAPGRGLPTRYHAAAINRVEHPRFGVDLASGVVDARAKHPATSMPEEGVQAHGINTSASSLGRSSARRRGLRGRCRWLGLL